MSGMEVILELAGRMVQQQLAGAERQQEELSRELAAARSRIAALEQELQQALTPA